MQPAHQKIFVCLIIGILNFPAFDESKAFHGETLFIQPTNSSYISEGDAAEIRRIFPNAEFRWIKQKSATTYFHFEKHTEFMQSVLGFLHGKDNRTKDDGNEETPKEEKTKKAKLISMFRRIKQKSATTYFHVKQSEFMQSVRVFLYGKENRTNHDGNEKTPKEENTKKGKLISMLIVQRKPILPDSIT